MIQVATSRNRFGGVPETPSHSPNILLKFSWGRAEGLWAHKFGKHWFKPSSVAVGLFPAGNPAIQ